MPRKRGRRRRVLGDVPGLRERTLGKLLKEQGFRLQANQKTREGSAHPDRDGQCEHINETVKAALAEMPGVRRSCMRTCVRMRWSSQEIAADERARLPGYGEEAVVRHFDAPDAVPTRFYEVRAKSILNRVPEASRMPFRWTINPYRGCTHACAYCSAGDTPVLMADGRHKPIRDLEVGDRIYGTEQLSTYRRYVITEVRDRWITLKSAYRVTLADGTDLIVSGDHRLLTNRGWRHVRNTEAGRRDRPHLTMRNRLVGTGAFAPQPVHTAQYQRGYLCGMIRGDGTPGTYGYTRPTGQPWTAHRLRLALTDLEALRRAREFLLGAGVATAQRVFQCATAGWREAVAISAQSAASVDSVRSLIEWPVLPSLDWCRGFLAGIFDAEGSRSDFALRIANTDPQILAWTEACARRLGFDTALDQIGRAHV